MLEIRPFARTDTEAVIEVWHLCGLLRPFNDPKKDIDRKLKVRPDLFLVGVAEGLIVATAMAGYDGHRGWVNYLGVRPQYQRLGYAARMMAEVERLLRQEGCPKVNLQVRTGNAPALAFYEKVGYRRDAVVGLGKRLEHDDR